jgi:DNA-binding transcriptional regulator WhiA
VAQKSDCCSRAELAAVYYINKAGGAPPDCLVTENAAFARRAYGMLRGLYKTSPEVIISRNKKLKKNSTFAIQINSRVGIPEMLAGGAAGERASEGMRKPNAAGDGPRSGGIALLRRLTRKKCCRKAALRGAFLAGGSVTDPEKLYHLEIYCKESDLASFFSELMSGFDLNPKITRRSDYSVAYVKDSEKIVDFLNITGAYRALMALENTRILKGVRNSVNRAVNCETANLEKTVNASMRQISNILYIKETVGYDSLPRNLREIAILRESNRDISLKELGQILDPPLGKSGVNHRLRKLDDIADNIRQITVQP